MQIVLEDLVRGLHGWGLKLPLDFILGYCPVIVMFLALNHAKSSPNPPKPLCAIHILSTKVYMQIVNN